MLPLGIKGTEMTVSRTGTDGTVNASKLKGADLGADDGITFSVDADIEVGDEVSYELPNGKTRTMRIQGTQVNKSPFGVGSNLDHTVAKYEMVTGKGALRQPQPVTLPGLHSLISAASGSQFATGHYDDAVFDAFKAVEDRVQALTGHPKSSNGTPLSGKGLMTAVFNEQNPQLDITSDNASANQKADEREGFKFLFMGGAQALRNTRGHGPSLQTGEQEAVEMLASASLLMRRLDRAEARQQQGGQQ